MAIFGRDPFKNKDGKRTLAFSPSANIEKAREICNDNQKNINNTIKLIDETADSLLIHLDHRPGDKKFIIGELINFKNKLIKKIYDENNI